MINKFPISEANAREEFGMACQRLVPWPGNDADGEPPFGAMACFLPAGASSEPDCHNQDELMIVLAGAGTVDIGGDQGAIATGDLVVIPRNRPHIVRNPGAGTLRWVSVYWPLHEPAGESAR